MRAVVLDVGETLIDETSEWGAWAEWLGVPRHTFSAMFGAVIAAGRDHSQVFQIFRPGLQVDAERWKRVESGRLGDIDEKDVYADVRPTLEELRRLGYQVGVAGNQPALVHDLLLDLRLPVDWIATSARWGVEKPSPGFFEHVISTCGCTAAEIAYVGDRLDNDILPARAAGLRTIFIRRGPWATWHAHESDSMPADLSIDSLDELKDRLSLVHD